MGARESHGAWRSNDCSARRCPERKGAFACLGKARGSLEKDSSGVGAAIAAGELARNQKRREASECVQTFKRLKDYFVGKGRSAGVESSFARRRISSRVGHWARRRLDR